jgi:hypothetical protein
MVSPNADENSAIVSAPTVPTLSPTAVSPTPTAVSMPNPAKKDYEKNTINFTDIKFNSKGRPV